MGLIVGLLVMAGAAFASASLFPYEAQESHFAYQLKSFRQALDECAEYLEIPPEVVDRLLAYNFLTHDRELKCLIRCAGINSGWWNDLTGVQGPVIESYFQPACGDINYHRRTQECIDSKLVACQDDCSRAYESFLCYFHQYGNLKCSEEYIPLSQLEAIQAAVDCYKILQIPRELLEQYSRGIIPDVPATHCMYRCQYLAEGLYDSHYGFNLTRFYIRHHDQPSLEFLTENTKACTDLALRDSCDECARVYRAGQCLPSCHEPGYTANVFRQAAGILLGCNDNGVLLPIPSIAKPLSAAIEPIPFVPAQPAFPPRPNNLPQPVPIPPHISLEPKPFGPPQTIIHSQPIIALPPNPPPQQHIPPPPPQPILPPPPPSFELPVPIVGRRPVIAPQPPLLDGPLLPIGPPHPDGPQHPLGPQISIGPHYPVGPQHPAGPQVPIERPPHPRGPPHPFFSPQQYFTPYSPPRPVCRYCNGLPPKTGCKHCSS